MNVCLALKLYAKIIIIIIIIEKNNNNKLWRFELLSDLTILDLPEIDAFSKIAQ